MLAAMETGAGASAKTAVRDCPVCARRTGVWATCDDCGYSTCKSCVAANIEANPQQHPRCMSCLADWGLAKVAQSTSATFARGKFRRIRQDFLLSRERALVPLSARSLAAQREIARLAGEIATADSRISAMSRENHTLPSWLRLLYKERASAPFKAIGKCTYCNGLLVRGKVAKGAPTTVHCAS